MNKFSHISLLLFLWFTVSVADAWARLDGEMEWGYAHYQQSGENNEDLTASHFTQRYSLLYSMRGLLADGRAGFYDLGIGAEWAGFESDFGESKISKDAFKSLYEGRLQIAPGALPFRLNVYSYDMDKVQFTRSGGLYSLDSVDPGPGSYGLIYPSIVTDLHNGQTIVSGVQFMAGIRNGTYLGKYREALSKWPRLLIDYRDVYRVDMKSRNPQKYRDRNLAFVSLNKRDNWFHYRINTHSDYLNPINDELETTIMLGTIDHTLKRQWINMTNWIRISVDGSYTESKYNWDPLKTERFDINFFSALNRRDFSANSLLNMQRIKRGNVVENALSVPVYLNQSLNSQTSVRSAFQVWRQKAVNGPDEAGEDAFYAKILLETQKHSRVQINPSVEMEIHTGDRGEGEAVRGRVEAFSNSQLRQKASWYGMASLAVFDGASESGERSDLGEGELQGNLRYRLRNNSLMGVEQYLLYGAGSYGTQPTRFMSAASGVGFGRFGASGDSAEDSSLFRSKSTLYLELASSTKMTNRFQLFYEFQESDGQRLDSLELSHRLTYRSRWWNVNLVHLYVVGDDSNYSVGGSGNLNLGASAASAREQFQQHGLFEFRPNNYWLGRLDTKIDWTKGTSEEDSLWFQLKQKLERTFYAASSVRRKRGDVTQSLRYEKFLNGVDRQAIVFSLAGNYYPTRSWRLGASVDYYDYDYQANVIYYSLTTGLDFPQFKVDFRYDYGASENANQVAHRYEVNVKKTF